MHDLRLSAHRAQAGIWRPHFRFALAQAVQAFDSDRNITKGVATQYLSWRFIRSILSCAEVEV
jgi:tRNA threonylcarbamoyladenosine modification (KEOPS) complex Cgi121 subunit